MRQKTKDKIGRYATGTLGGLTGLGMSDLNLGGIAGRLGAGLETQLDIFGTQANIKTAGFRLEKFVEDLFSNDLYGNTIHQMQEGVGLLDWANRSMSGLASQYMPEATIESLLGTGGYIIPIAKAAACVGVGVLAGVGAYYAGKYAYKAGKKIYDMCKSNKRKHRMHCDYAPLI